jgi:hypothetical protein
VKDATPFSEGARRNHGWLFVLDDDLQCIARPSERTLGIPPERELGALVEAAAAKWARSASHSEMLMMVTPTISARVFPMHGPQGSCTIVYLEPLVVRVDR